MKPRPPPARWPRPGCMPSGHGLPVTFRLREGDRRRRSDRAPSRRSPARPRRPRAAPCRRRAAAPARAAPRCTRALRPAMLPGAPIVAQNPHRRDRRLAGELHRRRDLRRIVEHEHVVTWPSVAAIDRRHARQRLRAVARGDADRDRWSRAAPARARGGRRRWCGPAVRRQDIAATAAAARAHAGHVRPARLHQARHGVARSRALSRGGTRMPVSPSRTRSRTQPTGVAIDRQPLAHRLQRHEAEAFVGGREHQRVVAAVLRPPRVPPTPVR